MQHRGESLFFLLFLSDSPEIILQPTSFITFKFDGTSGVGNIARVNRASMYATGSGGEGQFAVNFRVHVTHERTHFIFHNLLHGPYTINLKHIYFRLRDYRKISYVFHENTPERFRFSSQASLHLQNHTSQSPPPGPRQ
jgi:hypothetical protein